MEILTLSGAVDGKCEIKKDKTGKTYIRFRVVCWSVDMTGKRTARFYRCFTYNTDFADLKDGDIVFLSGKFQHNVHEGRVSFDVFCQNITPGFKEPLDRRD